MMYHAVQSLKIETGFFQTKLWQKVYILPESRDNLKKKSPNYIKIDMSTSCNDIKFMFSKKATKIDEIFTINLTLCSQCQIEGEDLVNFCGFPRKHQL